MTLRLLSENHLEFLRLKGACTGPSESTLVKMSHCWKSHVVAQLCILHTAVSLLLNKSMYSETAIAVTGVLCYVIESYIPLRSGDLCPRLMTFANRLMTFASCLDLGQDRQYVSGPTYIRLIWAQSI